MESIREAEGTTFSVAGSTPACFPGHARVRLANGFQVPMSAIAIGDEVEVDENAYSPVLMITHADKDIESTFIGIVTRDGSRIIASPTHYLHTVNGTLLEAGKFTVGHKLGVSPSKFDEVVSVERVRHKGLFNPQTASGTLMLYFGRSEPTLATTYTTAVRSVLAHTMMTPLRALDMVTGGTIPSLSAAILNTKYAVKVMRNLMLRKVIQPCIGLGLLLVLVTT